MTSLYLLIFIAASFAALWIAYQLGKEHGRWAAMDEYTRPAPIKPLKPVAPVMNERKQEIMNALGEFEHAINKVRKIQDALSQLHDMNKNEMDMLSALDRPSSNASHSLYKNSIIGQLKELRVKKLDLLKKLVKYGYNPPVKYTDGNGNTMEKRISEIIKEMEGAITAEDPAPKTENKNLKKRPVFKVIKNEEPKDVN